MAALDSVQFVEIFYLEARRLSYFVLPSMYSVANFRNNELFLRAFIFVAIKFSGYVNSF